MQPMQPRKSNDDSDAKTIKIDYSLPKYSNNGIWRCFVHSLDIVETIIVTKLPASMRWFFIACNYFKWTLFASQHLAKLMLLVTY